MRKFLLILLIALSGCQHPAKKEAINQPVSPETQQRFLEAMTLLQYQAEEITEGSTYNLLDGEAKRLKLDQTPYLYISHEPDLINAFFITNSTMPDGKGRGKVIVANEILKAMKDDELKAVFCHELGHLIREKTGQRIAPPGDINEESATDIFAAKAMGRDAYLKMFAALRKIVTEEQKTCDQKGKPPCLNYILSMQEIDFRARKVREAFVKTKKRSA